MKIAIMTVPFNNNYGGYLQAFALKQTLVELGHEVVFIIRRRIRQRPRRWRNLLNYMIGRDKFCQFLYERQIKRISVNTKKFEDKYLKPWTKEYYTTKELQKCRMLDADIFIAGSDQCWRAKFAPGYIDDYFFSFLKGSGKKRISYAASFGTEKMEFSPKLQQSCTDLLKEFSAISVREASGIGILENYLGVQKGFARQVVDPTLLLPIKAYKKLIDKNGMSGDRYIFTYILDETSDKHKLIDLIRKNLNINLITQKAQTGDIYKMKEIEPVELWLTHIFHSSFVITDSFHGMLFSVLFNKPFIVYCNKDRGSTRFQSFLDMFCLSNRLIEKSDEFDDTLLNSNIDWNHVNELISRERQRSLEFLMSNLIIG